MRDWRISSKSSSSDHRQVRFSLEHGEEIKWSRNSKHTNWVSYRTDLESILKKAPSSFHTIDNLELAMQFVNDIIKTVFEVNCEAEVHFIQGLLME